MKTILQTILTLFICTSSFAQLEWESRKSIPRYGRHAGVSFEIAGKIYVGLGRLADGSFSNELWEYDPASDNWTQKADYPPGGRFIPSAFSINGKGYVCLGQTSTLSLTNTLYEYDPTNDTWTQKANFIGAARYGAAAFVIGDTAYVGTGSNGSSSFLSDFYMYVPSTNTWTSRASYSGGSAANLASFTIGNHGYFGNKTTSSSAAPNNSFYKYFPSSNSWSSIASMPGAARRISAAFVLNNEAYVGCGTNSNSPVSTFLNDFYKYNPTTDSWSYQTSNSSFTPKIDPELFCIRDSVVFSVGGYGTNMSLSEVWELKLDLDTCDYHDTIYVTVQDTLTFKINIASVAQPQFVGVKVYPNPAGSQVTIAISDFTQLSNYTLKIYNTLGVEVFSQAVNASTYTINTSTIGVAGTYHLEVYDSLNAKRGRKTIIIQ